MALVLFISLSFDLAVSKNTAKFWSAVINNAKFDLAVEGDSSCPTDSVNDIIEFDSAE
jgi:hypothetical protein